MQIESCPTFSRWDKSLPKIGQLKYRLTLCIPTKQNIVGFNILMQNTMPMHKFKGLAELIQTVQHVISAKFQSGFVYRYPLAVFHYQVNIRGCQIIGRVLKYFI